MPASAPRRPRRWQAALISVLVGALALGAAAIGWWYARESPPHQGPIVLIAVDGLSHRDVGPDAANGVPAIAKLRAETVTFTRAYTHSAQTLPAYTTLLTGRLPFEHGVRDDGGFGLRPEVRTLAELLRNRGFATGGAVSTFLLRRETGVAQGFSFFDSTLPEGAARADAATAVAAPAVTVVTRSGVQTVERALEWAKSQGGQRYFLFVQTPRADADAVVERVVGELRARSWYEGATIVIVGGRATLDDGAALDDASLRVGLVVKQPRGTAGGQAITMPVQVADVVPTMLDLVRAPLPGGMHGRSLRAVLDDTDSTIPARPFYAESMAGYYRLGTAPRYALTTETRRLLRDARDTTVDLPAESTTSADPVPDTVPLGAVLDELVGGREPDRAQPVSAADEVPLALSGFLAGPNPLPVVQTDGVVGDSKTLAAHSRAAVLVGESKLQEAVQTLRGIVKAQPSLGAVHYEIGQLLARMGRLDEAASALASADAAWPDNLPIALALGDVLRRAGKLDQAATHAEAAVARAERGTARDRVSAHEVAARVALARKDTAAATSHAAVSAEVDPASLLPRFVKGRLLYDEGKYEEAVAAFSGDAAPAEAPAQPPVAELQLYMGESLAKLERHEDAEAAFRGEITAFPRDPRAYISLATLYRATKPEEVGDVLNDLVEAVPTLEGYGLAAAAWDSVGDVKRANALRADARVKFRGDPGLQRLRARGALR